MICLIKPQFEAGKEAVGKKGVVSDPSVHKSVILKTIEDAVKNGFVVLGLTYSPIKGPEGNIEYLVYLQKTDEKDRHLDSIESLEEDVVNKAHQLL
jgi:23S rRNA (cytidine1920-2'-O)/16S rRNA (cytidine1409-2'-O)-methyltransferase